MDSQISYVLQEQEPIKQNITFNNKHKNLLIIFSAVMASIIKLDFAVEQIFTQSCPDENKNITSLSMKYSISDN